VLVVMLALILTMPLSAAANLCERHRIPRAIGALLALLLIAAAIVGIGFLVIPPLIDEAKRLADAAPGIVSDLQHRIGEATGTKPSRVGHDIQRGLRNLIDDPQQLAGPVASVGLGVLGVIGTMVVVAMAAFYMATRPEPLREGLLSLFPAARRDDVVRVMDDIRSAWWGWLAGVAVDMVVSGTLLYIGLRIIDLDFAVLFATLTAVFVVVPYLGSIASGVPPVLFALSISPEKAALTLGVYVLVQQLEGNLIVPLVMSRTTSLHPAVILGGVVVVGKLLGFLGLLVAVPTISAVFILVRAIWIEPLHEGEQPAAGDATSTSGAGAPAVIAGQHAPEDVRLRSGPRRSRTA
jgi:predicted PurR-regulated permease PerM